MKITLAFIELMTFKVQELIRNFKLFIRRLFPECLPLRRHRKMPSL